MPSLTSVVTSAVLLGVMAGCASGGSRSSSGETCGLASESRTGEDVASSEGYKGLTLDEAEELAQARDVEVRIVGKDGKCFGRDDDLRFRRINLYLEDDRVVIAEGF